MRISQIEVSGLFGRFNHILPFKPNERITIMIGPNGFGKTMILQILNALFNQHVQSLGRMPFDDVIVCFEDLSTIKVSRLSNRRQQAARYERRPLHFEYRSRGHSPQRFDIKLLSTEDDHFPVRYIEELIPSLRRVSPSEWRDEDTGEILDLDDVAARFGDRSPFRSKGFQPPHPQWLDDLRKSMPVRFIRTERLTQSSNDTSLGLRTQRQSSNVSPQRTVRRYSDDLASKVQQTLTEYATLSQSLDRTFPVRLVEEPRTPRLSVHDLTQKLNEVEDKRLRLVDAGLLAQEDQDLSVTIPADESRRDVLAVYAQDALSKLSVFDDLYVRVDALKRIANARFLYKQVSVSRDGLKVTPQGGTDLELEVLSSGEQHELVILCDLLFGVVKDSLIMIDEPELSLHVAWQNKILSDLQQIADLSDFRVLLATHSPQVIGARWDLTVELQGPPVDDPS